MKKSVQFMVTAGIIAAIYAAVTIVLQPISYGVVQCRVSEAMTILPIFTPAAIPGLFVGCLVSNFFGTVGVADIIIGSLASLISAVGTYMLRKNIWLAPMPPVLVNAIIIGAMLKYVYDLPMNLLLCMLSVGAGQLVACYLLGIPLIKILEKHKNKIGL